MGKFTPLTDPKVDEMIERQLMRAVEAIRRIHPAAQAVVLLGGFGRGEGSAVVEGGSARALNDYDLLVISQDEGGREPLRQLSRELAGALGMDFVDIGLWRPDVLDTLPPTIFNYDLKHGAQVLFGDAALLARIPRFTAEQLPSWEGVQLLLNRMAGLLGGFALQEGAPRVVVRAPQYFRNQVVKAFLACGDALIVQEGEYTHRYAERCAIVCRWARGGNLDWLESEAVTHIIEAYEEKLAPGSAVWKDDVALFVGFLPALERVFLRCLSRYLGQTISRIDDGADTYLNHHRVGRLARLLSKVKPTVGVPARHAVYACLPLVVFSIPLQQPNQPRLTRRVHRILRMVDRPRTQLDATSGDGWERGRQACVHLWERHCHG
jgi:hypothetical protein